eukprot:365857-Chlamydomonas_euryale.AAC.3
MAASAPPSRVTSSGCTSVRASATAASASFTSARAPASPPPPPPWRAVIAAALLPTPGRMTDAPARQACTSAAHVRASASNSMRGAAAHTAKLVGSPPARKQSSSAARRPSRQPLARSAVAPASPRTPASRACTPDSARVVSIHASSAPPSPRPLQEHADNSRCPSSTPAPVCCCGAEVGRRSMLLAAVATMAAEVRLLGPRAVARAAGPVGSGLAAAAAACSSSSIAASSSESIPRSSATKALVSRASRSTGPCPSDSHELAAAAGTWVDCVVVALSDKAAAEGAVAAAAAFANRWQTAGSAPPWSLSASVSAVAGCWRCTAAFSAAEGAATAGTQPSPDR